MIFSCGQNFSDSGTSEIGHDGENFEELLDIPLTEQPPPPPPPKNISANEISRKLIKSGRLELESKNFQKDRQVILDYLGKFGGYVEQENENNSEFRKTLFLTIRIPSNSFDSMFILSTAVGRKVINRSVNVEDATLRYLDLEASIESSKALENRYREILKQANSIKDILEIEKSLNSIRAEIDLYESRFRNLSSKISYSSLEIILSENVTVAENPDLGYLNKLINSFGYGWKGLGQFLLGIVSIWPFILVAGLIGFLIRRRIKKK
ncbi:hypothetical protein GCM10026987_37060 [Belliella aquatica]|uniref:DUF4349 domain-containing protein n=2 Tax=Belliella aquatica TaxID=1323734 RepID=A0ABQ1N5V5_9BACT|nr:hypothetical protein GCM10010993_30000 [Belliella aquatica]